MEVTGDGSDVNGIVDGAVAGADREALRYQAFCVDRLLARVKPAPGSRLLDICAGTGLLAVGAVQWLGPGGRVTAIDLSEPLLSRLEAKIRQFGISNIDVHVMDGAHLDFRHDYFRYVLCSLGLHRFADAHAAVREWRRVLSPGGTLGCATLAGGAFQPQLGLLQRRLAQAGVADSIPWAETGDRQVLQSLLHEAGFTDIEFFDVQLGYHLDSPELWWHVIEYSPLRAWIEPLTRQERQALKSAHLAEVEPLAGANGLWLDVPVVLAVARKPGG